MAHRKITRPKQNATEQEVAAYRREVAKALTELGVGYGEEFVVVSVAEVQNRKLYNVDEVDDNSLGAFPGGGSDTARKAALDNYPRSGTQREKILLALVLAGDRGLTSDEIAADGMNLYSVKPRLIELREGGWAAQNGKTRPSPRGSATDVYVATEKGTSTVRERRRRVA